MHTIKATRHEQHGTCHHLSQLQIPQLSIERFERPGGHSWTAMDFEHEFREFPHRSDRGSLEENARRQRQLAERIHMINDERGAQAADSL